MDEKEVFNPQSGERISPKKPKKFWNDWRFYVYTVIALMLAIVSVSSMVTACAAINAGVGQSESVSTQYKVKHNEQITTAHGGYTGYSFSVYSDFGTTTIDEGNMIMRRYVVDKETFTLSTPPVFDQFTITSVADIKTAIDSYYETYTATSDLSFLAFYGVVPNYGATNKVSYFTFVIPSGTQGYYVNPLPFVLINPSSTARTGTLETGGYSLGGLYENNTYYTIPNGRNPYALFDSADGPTRPTFQDIESYYKSMGYSSGYSEGHTAGYAEGYDAGETHAYDTIKTGIAFETYGMYADAKISLVADRTEGSYYYMDLFDYVTDTNTERSVYVLYTQNASNSTWLGYVQDVNASDSYGATYDIGSFTGATSTTDVVFTALMDRNLWEGAYITSFHGHAEAVNNAFWFTGGSYAATQQIYQDGYGEGYDVGRSDGYDLGYDAGVQVGRTQGMNEAEPESLTNTLVAVFQQPFNQLYRFFNFNVLGLNVLGIVSGLVSVLVVVKVFKKLYK